MLESLLYACDSVLVVCDTITLTCSFQCIFSSYRLIRLVGWILEGWRASMVLGDQ